MSATYLFPVAIGTPAADNGAISGVDIGPNDVLCGRGLRISKNPGNVAFLSLVTSRKSEYFAAKTKKEKQRIAKEIVDHVRHRAEPPGRFLELVDKNAPFWNEKWCLADDETALEKVKQALRNKQKGGKEQRPTPSGKPLEPPAGGSEAKTELQSKSEAKAERQSKSGKDGNEISNDFESEVVAPLDLSITALGEEKPADITPGAQFFKEKKVTSVQDWRASLLDSIHTVLKLAENMRGKYNIDNVRAGGTFFSPNDQISSDLVDLGSALYRGFSGAGPSEGEMGSHDGSKCVTTAFRKSSIPEVAQPKKRERRSDSRTHTPLRDFGLPVSLSILVSSLMDAKNDDVPDRYKSFEEVEEDLRLMINSPDRYLFDADLEKRTGKLQIPEGKVYGREEQVLQLTSALDRVTGYGGKPEMALISGYSGTGKSILVQQLCKPLLAKRGHFVSGKFDEQGQVQPMMVIFSAFNEYCKDILEGDKDDLSRISMAIKDALGSHGNVLMSLIPNLSRVIGEPTSVCLQVGGKEALNRLYFYFRVFVRAIASPSHPVIFFLDDLQWADKASLDLVSMLLLDTDMKSFLFVGCYRDNEVGVDHPLNVAVGSLALAGVTASNIQLENIDCKDVNALISDTLHLSPRLTQSLANVVYAKTRGNPLFAVQFLLSLFEEKNLLYSAISRRWEWDVEAIQSKDIADNVVDLMTKKMLALPFASQWLLGLAACLGSRCEASTLKLLGADDKGITTILEDIVDDGIMYKTGSYYKFSHDQIQEAAYALIPADERHAVHLHVGRMLWKKASIEELRNIVFIVVDQLQRGSDLVSDHEEKVQIAGLCLMAGEKAISSSAFVQASVYLLQGTALLEESDWEAHYDLCLKLFSLCAEAQYATGNYEGVTITLNPVLLRGRCLQDKLSPFYTLLNSLGGQGNYLDVIDTGCGVLAQLGEPFESETNQGMVMKEFTKTRGLLQGYTTDNILNKEEMKDADKIAVMKLLMILVKYAFYVKPELNALMFFRMVQLTLSHGICKETPFAFAGYSMILCKFGQQEAAYPYGKLALSLVDKVKAEQYLPRVQCIGFFINQFKEPLQAGLPQLKIGYEVGMSIGDIEWALTNARMYILASVYVGRELETLADEVKVFVQQMKEHRHHLLQIVLPIQQAILNLAGCSDDPVVLTGEAMNQDKLLSSALENQHLIVVENVYFQRLWLAYLFGKYHVAAEMVERCHGLKSRALETVIYETFYIGLVAVVMARQGDQRCDWRSIAYESLEKMTEWAGNSAWNCQHKFELLNAEVARLNGDISKAEEAYEIAIRSAGEHGFVHEQALACERAGMFYSEVFDSATAAKGYYEKSHECYLQWGAKAKAEMIFCDFLMTNK